MHGLSGAFSRGRSRCNRLRTDRMFFAPKKKKQSVPRFSFRDKSKKCQLQCANQPRNARLQLRLPQRPHTLRQLHTILKTRVLLDGTIYAGAYKQFIADKSLFVSSVRELCHLKSSGLASSYIGTKYFGHWLIDDCLTYRLAQQLSTPLCLRSPNPSWHQKQYEDYFDQDWTPTDRALIDDLIVFQDFAQNSLKRKRYNTLRDRIKTRFQRDGTDAYVYLRRGQTGAIRVIQNEHEIIDALIKRSFVVLDLASDSLEKIIKNSFECKNYRHAGGKPGRTLRVYNSRKQWVTPAPIARPILQRLQGLD